MRTISLIFVFISSISCAQQTESKKSELCQPKIKPQVEYTGLNLNPHYKNFIVAYDKIHPLKPSGKKVREYRVQSIQMKKLVDQTYTFKMPETESEKVQTIEQLSEIGEIQFLEPDYEIREATFNKAQWAHQLIQSELAWTQSQGASNLVVAVVDSGIDYNHIDLKSIIWKNNLEVLNGRDDDLNGYIDDVQGWNFAENNNDPRTSSTSNHGTHVAGIIGSQGLTASSIRGESKSVQLMPLRFIGEEGTGSTSNAIRAIDYAIAKKVFAINNSWGSSSRSEALSKAITRAEKAGILFLAAAGNDGNDLSRQPFYPASFPHSNIISVAATGSDDKLTSFSNFSEDWVDVAAPGSQIISTVTGNRYMKMSGTSMATPFVAGLAVLVKAANQKLNYSEIKSIIKSTVDQKVGLKYKIESKGRINARKAVNLAKQYENLCSN